MPTVQADLGRAVSRFCAELKREGYRVDREQAGGLQFVLVRDWQGEVTGHYVASAEEDGVHIDEVKHWPG